MSDFLRVKMPVLNRKRKFVIAATALIMTFVLALTGVVEGGEWVGAVSAIVGLYGGAEAAEGYANARYPKVPIDG